MEKKIITYTQRTTMFNEWLCQYPIPKFNTKEECQKWWIMKCIEHDKLIHEEGYDIIPEFYITDDEKNQ